jgi:hypothetical protein
MHSWRGLKDQGRGARRSVYPNLRVVRSKPAVCTEYLPVRTSNSPQDCYNYS